MKLIEKSSNTQTVQRLLSRMSLRAYFEALSDTLADDRYMNIYRRLLKCTSVDSNYEMLDNPKTGNQQYINEHITVGEMLRIAMQLIQHYKGPQWPADDKRREREQDEIGCTIVEMILVRPMLEVTEMLSAYTTTDNSITKG